MRDMEYCLDNVFIGSHMGIGEPMRVSMKISHAMLTNFPFSHLKRDRLQEGARKSFRKHTAKHNSSFSCADCMMLCALQPNLQLHIVRIRCQRKYTEPISITKPCNKGKKNFDGKIFSLKKQRYKSASGRRKMILRQKK